jgi:hypothetical protein
MTPEYTVEEGENIFKIIADWRGAAKKAGWSREEIETVLAKVRLAASYEDAMDIIAENCSGY